MGRCPQQPLTGPDSGARAAAAADAAHAGRPEPPAQQLLPAGFCWVAAPAPGWRTEPGGQCRGWDSRRPCQTPAVAAYNRKRLTRAGYADSWWRYCAEHMYRQQAEGNVMRWVEDGTVMCWEPRRVVSR